MPTYGEDKVRDIAESILPSTARRRAREERKAIHRRERRRVRQQFPDDDLVGNDRQVRIDIDHMKWERRGADKLGPVMRWAEARTASIEDPVERYQMMRALLPDNLIGRHALSHIDDLEGIEPPGFNHVADWRYINANRRRKTVPTRDYEATLRLVIEDGRQAALNRTMRLYHRRPYLGLRRQYRDQIPGRAAFRTLKDYGHVVRLFKTEKGWYKPAKPVTVPCVCEPRTLKGLHDIAAFMADMGRHSMRQTDWQEYVAHHPEWKEGLDTFLDEHYPLV